jgi:hypothetical protein
MYNPSTYVVKTYFPTYLSIYIYEWLLLITEYVIKVKSNFYSVEVLSQLSSCNGHHPVDGVLVGAGLLWPIQSINEPSEVPS